MGINAREGCAHSSTNVEQVLIEQRPTLARKISAKLYSRVGKYLTTRWQAFRTRHRTKSFAENTESQPLSSAERIFRLLREIRKTCPSFSFVPISDLRPREPCATFVSGLMKIIGNFNSKILSFGRRVID